MAAPARAGKRLDIRVTCSEWSEMTWGYETWLGRLGYQRPKQVLVVSNDLLPTCMRC